MIAYRRLNHQRIAPAARLEEPEEVVRHLGAVQAQDYHQAMWAIGSRTQGATLADVERAIEEGRIVLSWPMRGTIHAVPSEELRLLLKLSASRRLTQDKRRMEQLELTDAIVERCGLLMENALRGGGRITRDALMQLFEAEGVRTDGQRGYHIIWRLAQSGRICLGPKDGKRQTFVLAEEWLPADAGEWDRSEALGRLAVRFFAGHGPATVQDLAWWAGLTLTEAREAAEAAAGELTLLRVGDREYWEAGGLPGESGTAEEEDSGSSVFLLAGFDEMLLGYRDREAVLPDEVAPYVAPGNNGIFMPTVAIGGRIAGIWKRTVKPKRIDVEFKLSVPQAEWEELLVREARRYCDFMGLPLGEATFRALGE
ncbi:AlkZ family DNA glycosylase [Cohnella sp. CBP 2801]|uniref:AlkZ family DNA glycosylase n=2 Tax=Cohnella zeiphila TaxID=2761120 RepID=A0A7X0SMU0_9BACL|nr:AlkZ family DNA glycosylase [Cohnella zeiphila]